MRTVCECDKEKRRGVCDGAGECKHSRPVPLPFHALSFPPKLISSSLWVQWARQKIDRSTLCYRWGLSPVYGDYRLRHSPLFLLPAPVCDMCVCVSTIFLSSKHRACYVSPNIAYPSQREEDAPGMCLEQYKEGPARYRCCVCVVRLPTSFVLIFQLLGAPLHAECR